MTNVSETKAYAPCKCCLEQFLLPVFDQTKKQFVCNECLKTYEDGKFYPRNLL